MPGHGRGGGIGVANGVQFSQLATRSLTQAEIKEAGFGEVFSHDATAGTWFAQPKGARFIRSLQAGKKVTIVTLGTSLTGGAWRWPDVMREWLDKDFPGLATIHNLGVGASASSQPPGKSGLGMVKQAVTLKPDAVIIEFATNDAFLPYKISPADSKRNLHTMIDTVLAADPKADIILQTMNSCIDKPGGGRHATDRPELAAYCQVYRDVARERCLLLVDHYPNWLAH